MTVDLITFIDLKAYAAGIYVEGLTLLGILLLLLVAFRGKLINELRSWRNEL